MGSSSDSDEEIILLWYLMTRMEDRERKRRRQQLEERSQTSNGKRRNMRSSETAAMGCPQETANGKKCSRRAWINEKLQKSRDQYGMYYPLREMLSTEDRIYQNLNIAAVDFQEILELISDDIKKKSHLRQSLTPDQRLAVTLRWLNTTLKFEDLGDQLGIGGGTCRQVCLEVFEAINKHMHSIGMRECSPEDLAESARKFEAKWNFPNCVAALEGIHIRLSRGGIEDVDIRNYVEKLSVVLFILVDASYCFLAAEVIPGDQKTVEDFQMSLLSNMISEDSIPPPKLLPKSGIYLPHIVVAGDSFPHTKYLMTPYTSQNLEESPKKAVYNARHFQAMSVATDTIGLFVQRFRNFSKTWFSSYEFTTKMVKACCILHNFLRRKDIERNLGQFDPDEVREVVRKTNIFMPLPSYFGVSTTIAQEVRENFCTHFLSENHSESKFVVQEDSKNSIVEGTDSCIVNMKIEIEYPEVDGSADDSLQSAKNCPMQQISTSEEVHGNLLRRLLLETQSTPNFCVDEVVKENSIVERTGECTVNVKTELKSSEPEGTEECTVNVKTEIKSESDDSEEWKTESIAHCSYSDSQ